MAKVDLSQLKGVLGKFGFLRSYSSLVIPLVILVAGFVVFGVVLLMGSSFKKTAKKESVPLASNVKSLAASAVPLGQVEIEKAYEQQWQQDANHVALLVKQTTQRELLSCEMFPEPKDKSMLIFDAFGRSYRAGIDALIQKVNGRDCPTDAEIERALPRTRGMKLGRGGARRMLSRRQGVEATITDELCREKAASAAVYVNASDMPGYDLWKDYKYQTRDDAIKDCWYWQVGYWIVEDAFGTIEAINGDSQSVYTSPVKRLLGVNFTGEKKMYGAKRRRTSKTSSSGEGPYYVYEIQDGLSESFTGRLTNNEIDVIHFELRAVVSAKSVMEFMKELCSSKEHIFTGYDGTVPPKRFVHNQITILESNINPIDKDSNENYLYRYGDDAVVEVDAMCEYIFDRAGYDVLKPESVKKALEKSKKKNRR